MKRRVFNIGLKAAVAIALTVALIRKMHWGDVAASAKQISLVSILILMTLAIVMTVVSCLKWSLFLRARGLRVPLGRLVRLYITGYFFNTFLPGNVGGDVMRSYALGRSLNNQADAFGTVFLERFTGVIAMIGLGVGAALIQPSLMRTPQLRWVVAAMALLFISSVSVLLVAPLQRLLLQILDRLPDTGIPRKLRRFLAVVFHFRNRPDILGRAMLWSISFHGLTVVNTWIACWAVGAPARLLDLAALVPMVLMISSVPISLNAIGIMEGAFVYFLSSAGVPPAAGMAVALIMRAKNVLLAIVGGILFGVVKNPEPAGEENDK